MAERGASLGRLRHGPTCWPACLFAALGAVILWVGADYPLGVPSRIGPGYVPRLLGILLAGIGLFLIVRSWWTIEAVDPVDRLAPAGADARCRGRFRTGVRGDRPRTGDPRLGRHRQLRHAREPLDDGDRARRDARPLRLGAVRQGPVAAAAGLVAGESDLLPEPGLRLRHRRDAAEPAVLPDRRAARNAGRRAAGARAGRHHRHAAARHVHAAAGGGAHHAGRPLLRGPVRRLDHGDPGQHPRRELLGRHHAGRPCHGPQGPRRLGARHSRARLVLRGLRGDGHRCRVLAAAGARWRAASGRPTISACWCSAWWPPWCWRRAPWCARSPWWCSACSSA